MKKGRYLRLEVSSIAATNALVHVQSSIAKSNMIAPTYMINNEYAWDETTWDKVVKTHPSLSLPIVPLR